MKNSHTFCDKHTSFLSSLSFKFDKFKQNNGITKKKRKEIFHKNEKNFETLKNGPNRFMKKNVTNIHKYYTVMIEIEKKIQCPWETVNGNNNFFGKEK